MYIRITSNLFRSLLIFDLIFHRNPNPDVTVETAKFYLEASNFNIEEALAFSDQPATQISPSDGDFTDMTDSSAALHSFAANNDVVGLVEFRRCNPGISLDSMNAYGSTPLVEACKNSAEDATRFL